MLRGYRMISCAMVIALAGFFYTPSTANAELQQGNPATSNPTIYKQKHLQEIGQVAQAWGQRHRSFSKVRLLRVLDARCKRGNRRACTQFKLFSKRYPAALQKMRSAQVRKPGRTNPRNRQAISSTRSTNNSGGAAVKARIAQLEKELAASMSKGQAAAQAKARIADLESQLADPHNIPAVKERLDGAVAYYKNQIKNRYRAYKALQAKLRATQGSPARPASSPLDFTRADVFYKKCEQSMNKRKESKFERIRGMYDLGFCRAIECAMNRGGWTT